MTQPLIGITSREFDGRSLPAVGVYSPYVEAIAAAGGAPVLVPLSGNSERWIDGVVGGLHGVLFTGGEDIEPARYGEGNSPKLGPISRVRDEVEGGIFRAARARGMPILGICRGLQFINVACGGSLYQDLPSELSEAQLHARGSTEWRDLSHTVVIETGSALRHIASVERCAVNSLHHQAIKELGRGLTVGARCAADGTVEAIEGAGPGWLLAVQWHPEVLWDGEEGAPHRAIFEAFVGEAARFRTRAG